MDSLLKDIESDLERGQRHLAVLKLRKLKIADIPRRLSGEAAALARRAGLEEMGLSLLNPIVRTKNPSAKKATDFEKTIYAALLIRIGAEEEALVILEDVDGKLLPDAFLFTSHAHVAHWDYQKSIPVLEQYLSSKLTERQRVIGQLNLAAAFVHEGHNEPANKLLQTLLVAAEKFPVFLGNTLELSAQLMIHMKEWKKAADYLDQAETRLRENGGMDVFFVEKWRIFLQVSKDEKHNCSPILQLRKKALALQHWETVRDCDLLIAKLKNDLSLFTHLYYGTPFEAFRKRIFLEYGKPLALPRHYEWHLNEEKKKEATSLDEIEALQGKLAGRLAQVLTTDFYRPFSLGTLFTKLYPDEFFHPTSSPVRIYQLVKVLRAILKKEVTSLNLERTEQGYRLTSPSGCCIRLGPPEKRENVRSSIDVILDLPFDELDSAKVATHLKISPSSAQRILREAVEKEILIRQGSGRATHYVRTEKKTALRKV